MLNDHSLIKLKSRKEKMLKLKLQIYRKTQVIAGLKYARKGAVR